MVTAVETVRKSIRKALEVPLRLAMEGATPKIAVAWSNIPFDPTKPLPGMTALVAEYVRFSIHYAKPIVREIGPTPRIEQSGIAKIGVFTKTGSGQDRNDSIAGIVAAAYPYNAKLSFDGIDVIVETTHQGDAVPHEGWFYSPVDVYWNLWRST